MSAGIVTGEAVPLDIRLASWPSRALAFIIDAAVQFGAFVILTLVFFGFLNITNTLEMAAIAAVMVTFAVAIFVGYPVTCETLWRGRTLGKAALGLRVVGEDGGSIRFRQALTRGLLGLFCDLWATWGIVALVTSVVSKRGKRVGDMLAGTVVIKERVPRSRDVVAQMPPQLAGWAQLLDLSALPDGLALEARQLLGRYRQLDPAIRTSLELRLAGAIAAIVTPPPPPGTPPWAYLSAVLAERRRREEARLVR